MMRVTGLKKQLSQLEAHHWNPSVIHFHQKQCSPRVYLRQSSAHFSLPGGWVFWEITTHMANEWISPSEWRYQLLEEQRFATWKVGEQGSTWPVGAVPCLPREGGKHLPASRHLSLPHLWLSLLSSTPITRPPHPPSPRLPNEPVPPPAAKLIFLNLLDKMKRESWLFNLVVFFSNTEMSNISMCAVCELKHVASGPVIPQGTSALQKIRSEKPQSCITYLSLKKWKVFFLPLKVTAISPLHIKTPAFGKHVSALPNPSFGTELPTSKVMVRSRPWEHPSVPAHSQLLSISHGLSSHNNTHPEERNSLNNPGCHPGRRATPKALHRLSLTWNLKNCENVTWGWMII